MFVFLLPGDLKTVERAALLLLRRSCPHCRLAPVKAGETRGNSCKAVGRSELAAIVVGTEEEGETEIVVADDEYLFKVLEEFIIKICFWFHRPRPKGCAEGGVGSKKYVTSDTHYLNSYMCPCLGQ